VLLGNANSPLVLGLDRGERSDWLYIANGSLGYRWIKPKFPRTVLQSWVSDHDDAWAFYPPDGFLKTDHHLLGFGYAHQSSTRGESSRWYLNLPILVLAIFLITLKIAFGRATAPPIAPFPEATAPSANVENPATRVVLPYRPFTAKDRIPHPIGIRILAAATATFFAGLALYLPLLRQHTLGGVCDWIGGTLIGGAGAIYFFLIAIGRFTKRI
jgi:hypothetical protein